MLKRTTLSFLAVCSIAAPGCGDDSSDGSGGGGGSGTTTSTVTSGGTTTGSSMTTNTATNGSTTASTSTTAGTTTGTTTGGGACVLPDTTAPTTCDEACSDLYDCGALVCNGDTCPGFDGTPADKQEFMTGCIPGCMEQMAVIGLIDPSSCDTTIASISGLNTQFEDICQNGL